MGKSPIQSLIMAYILQVLHYKLGLLVHPVMCETVNMYSVPCFSLFQRPMTQLILTSLSVCIHVHKD